MHIKIIRLYKLWNICNNYFRRLPVNCTTTVHWSSGSNIILITHPILHIVIVSSRLPGMTSSENNGILTWWYIYIITPAYLYCNIVTWYHVYNSGSGLELCWPASIISRIRLFGFYHSQLACDGRISICFDGHTALW